MPNSFASASANVQIHSLMNSTETTNNSTTMEEACITTLATILKTLKYTIMTTVVQRIEMAAASIIEDIVMTTATASNNRMSEMTTCGSPTCVTACLKDVTSHLRGSVEPGLGWVSVYASWCQETTLHGRAAAMESTTNTTCAVLLVEGKATSEPDQAWRPLTAAPQSQTKSASRPVWRRSPDEFEPGRPNKRKKRDMFLLMPLRPYCIYSELFGDGLLTPYGWNSVVNWDF